MILFALSAIWWVMGVRCMKDKPPRRFISPCVTPKYAVEWLKTCKYHFGVWRFLMEPMYTPTPEGPLIELLPGAWASPTLCC